MTEKADLRDVSALTALVLLPRLLLALFAENVQGDAVVRTELAVAWAEAPRLIAGFEGGARQFGPLHIYLIGLFHQLFADARVAGKVVSLLAATASVPPLLWLSSLLVGRRAAVVACLGFAAWGLHIQCSTTAASEALNLSLILWGLWLFARSSARASTADAALSGTALTLACATRYDSWLLAPLLFVFLLLRGRGGLQRALVFGMTAAAFPLSWLLGSWLIDGDPLVVVRFIDVEHRRWFGEEVARHGALYMAAQALGFWPGAALVTLSPAVGLLGMWGAARAAREGSMPRWYLAVLLLPALYFTARGLLGSFVPLARFTVVQTALLLPFVWSGYGRALVALRGARWLAPVTVALAVATPIAIGLTAAVGTSRLARALSPVSPLARNEPEVRRLAAALTEALAAAPGATVLIDADAGYRDIQLIDQLVEVARLGEDRVVRARAGGPHERLRGLEPEFVVLSRQGVLGESSLSRSGQLILSAGALSLFKRPVGPTSAR